MNRLNTYLPIFALSIAIPLSNSSALNVSGRDSVYVNELGRNVRVQKKSDTKEFVIDYTDLASVELKLIAPSGAAKCDEWRKAVTKAEGQLPASFYQKTQARLVLKVLNVNAQAEVAAALGEGWMNVGRPEFSRVSFKYQWESDALTLQAGAQVGAAIQSDIERKLNSPEAHLAVRDTGGTALDINNILFVCDLLENKVSLSVSADGTLFSIFHVPSKLNPTDIVEISKNVVATSGVLKSEAPNISGAESSKVVNAAGLLGYQMQKQGYGTEIFASGDFLRIFSKIFERGVSEPGALSFDGARDLVKSLAGATPVRKDFNISQSLTLKTE